MAATPIPTEEDIMRHRNVPVSVAAKYLGWSAPTIYRALIQERAPFGFAAQNPETRSWTYHISPGLLIKYQQGELPAYKLKEVIRLAADGVEEVLDARLSSVQKILNALAEIK